MDELTGAFVFKKEDLRFKPLGVEEDQLNSIMRTNLNKTDFKIIVQFIYSDHILEGAAGTMRFRLPPERMSKLIN